MRKSKRRRENKEKEDDILGERDVKLYSFIDTKLS